MSAARDLFRERRFLADAAQGHSAFLEHVETRLAAGEDQFGSSWAWIGIARHLRELLEEAADLGAWAVLADQALDREHSIDDTRKTQIRSVLTIAAVHGARAHRTLSQALDLIDRTCAS